MKITLKSSQNKTTMMSKPLLVLLVSVSLVALTNCETYDDDDHDHRHNRGTTTTTTTEETTLRTPTTVVPLSTTVETKTRRSY
jgi:hypothetical protein